MRGPARSEARREGEGENQSGANLSGENLSGSRVGLSPEEPLTRWARTTARGRAEVKLRAILLQNGRVVIDPETGSARFAPRVRAGARRSPRRATRASCATGRQGRRRLHRVQLADTPRRTRWEATRWHRVRGLWTEARTGGVARPERPAAGAEHRRTQPRRPGGSGCSPSLGRWRCGWATTVPCSARYANVSPPGSCRRCGGSPSARTA